MGLNTVQHVWGSDREAMTTDPCAGAYVANVSASAGTSLTFDTSSQVRDENPQGAVVGGAVTVIAGRGAGQVRRLVATTFNGTVELDYPFTTSLDASSLVQLSDMRGKMIFERNRYVDVGAFQLYGNAQDVVMSSNTFARSTGVFAWSLAESDHDYCPNLRVQIEKTRIAEGNHVFNYVSNRLQANGGGVEPYSVAVRDGGVQFTDHLPYSGALNRLIVLRDNAVANNGGVFVGGSSADVLIERCTVANSTCPDCSAEGADQAMYCAKGAATVQEGRCIAVDHSRATGVVMRGNRYLEEGAAAALPA